MAISISLRKKLLQLSIQGRGGMDQEGTKVSHEVNVVLLPCEQGSILSGLLTGSRGQLGHAASEMGRLQTVLHIPLEKARRPLLQGLEANCLPV